MHKFILKCFEFFRSTLQFITVICMFIILLILLYWIQNLIGTTWFWFSFITPFLDGILNLAEQISSYSVSFFGAAFEMKYVVAIALVIIVIIITNVISNASHEVQRIYHNSHLIFKKISENSFNNKLQQNVEKQEKKLLKYSVTLKGKLKKKFAIDEFNANAEGINTQINQFIIKQLGLRPSDSSFKKDDVCYISEYRFDNFNNIDNVLEILFKILKTQNYLEYAVCVQIDNNQTKLNKLLSLNHFNKITMAADTAYRYTYVKNPKYTTTMVGVFQNGDDTLEVHEFMQNI